MADAESTSQHHHHNPPYTQTVCSTAENDFLNALNPIFPVWLKSVSSVRIFMAVASFMCCETATNQLLQPKNLHHNLSLMRLPNHFCFIQVQGAQSHPDTPKNPKVGLPKPPSAAPRAARAGTATAGGTKRRTEVRFKELGTKNGL